MSGNSRELNPTVVTGATGGIGYEVARMLIKDKRPIILGCRNLQKGAEVKDKLSKEFRECAVEILELDLAKRESIENFACALEGRKIEALVNVAGVLAPKFELLDEGYEKNCTVNLLGNTSLIKLLKPLMVEGARVVNVISCTVWMVEIDENYLENSRHKPSCGYFRLISYAKSKLALLYSSFVMAKTYRDIEVVVADPGVVNTSMISMQKWYDPLADIFFRPFIKSGFQGARPIYRALSQPICKSGCLTLFKGDKKGKEIKFKKRENAIVEKLWSELAKIR